jgi:hypothetical protein
MITRNSYNGFACYDALWCEDRTSSTGSNAEAAFRKRQLYARQTTYLR